MTVNTVGSYETILYPRSLKVEFDDGNNMYYFTPDGASAPAFAVTATVMATLLNDLLSALPQGDDVVGADGELVNLIPEWYYDGTKTLKAGDSNLIPANIVNGETIFGVTWA